MGLNDLTDQHAVKLALAEFDALGRRAFLEKYGFGPARSYFILHEGRRYDSKAVVGAAHGYEFPTLGPLGAGDFSGGEATVARRLRSLGFEVLSLRHSPRPRTWAFCANPTRYRIFEAVSHLSYDLWSIARSDVRAGDRAIVWQTLDSQGHRGVVAFAEVLSDPMVQRDDNPYWVDPGEGQALRTRVNVAYVVPEGLPLWVDESESGRFLASLSVARAQGGTIFHVEAEQWEHLVSLVDYAPPSPEALEVEQLVRDRAGGGVGQGFGLTSAERKVVEEYAMNLAISYFHRDWERVTDVSSRCSYDLLCSRAGEELRVEVKGTTTAGQGVVMTRNEIDEARGDDYCLFVVSGIELERSSEEPAASAGVARCYFPWSPTTDDLRPLSYLCSLDSSSGTVITGLTASRDARP